MEGLRPIKGGVLDAAVERAGGQEGGIKTEMEKSEVPNNQAFGTQGSGPLGAEVQEARPYESVETFINKTPIYRRENDQCQNYKVGSKFYLGHLMDAARRSWLERARP